MAATIAHNPNQTSSSTSCPSPRTKYALAPETTHKSQLCEHGKSITAFWDVNWDVQSPMRCEAANNQPLRSSRAHRNPRNLRKCQTLYERFGPITKHFGCTGVRKAYLWTGSLFRRKLSRTPCLVTWQACVGWDSLGLTWNYISQLAKAKWSGLFSMLVAPWNFRTLKKT